MRYRNKVSAKFVEDPVGSRAVILGKANVTIVIKGDVSKEEAEEILKEITAENTDVWWELPSVGNHVGLSMDLKSHEIAVHKSLRAPRSETPVSSPPPRLKPSLKVVK